MAYIIAGVVAWMLVCAFIVISLSANSSNISRIEEGNGVYRDEDS